MANQTISVHAGIYGMGIYAIMLPSSGFSVAHCQFMMIVLIDDVDRDILAVMMMIDSRGG